MRGRRIGTTEVSVSTIKRIVELTNKGLSRRAIADEVGFSKTTVYYYQKKYNVC